MFVELIFWSIKFSFNIFLQFLRKHFLYLRKLKRFLHLCNIICFSFIFWFQVIIEKQIFFFYWFLILIDLIKRLTDEYVFSFLSLINFRKTFCCMIVRFSYQRINSCFSCYKFDILLLFFIFFIAFSNTRVVLLSWDWVFHPEV